MLPKDIKHALKVYKNDDYGNNAAKIKYFLVKRFFLRENSIQKDPGRFA